MKLIIFISLLSTFLLAQNPKAYSALGDAIYDNVDNISKLQEIDTYTPYSARIQDYIADVSQAKTMGLSIDNGDKAVEKLSYLKNLRKLSKENDFFMRTSKGSFKSSIERENSQLFSQIINTGLIDTQKYKDEIINYYMFHADDINSSGVIQRYLDEDEQRRLEKQRNVKVYKTKAQIQAERIKRIRNNDLRKQAEIEESLQEEVDRKKVEIRVNQKKELAL